MEKYSKELLIVADSAAIVTSILGCFMILYIKAHTQEGKEGIVFTIQ